MAGSEWIEMELTVRVEASSEGSSLGSLSLVEMPILLPGTGSRLQVQTSCFFKKGSQSALSPSKFGVWLSLVPISPGCWPLSLWLL